MDFEAVRPDGEIVTSGHAGLHSIGAAQAEFEMKHAGFTDGPIPNPPLAGVSEVIARQRLVPWKFEFDPVRDCSFVQHLDSDDPWQGRSDAHPAFVVSAANVLIRSAIDFVDGRWLQGGANMAFFRPIPAGSKLTFTGRMGDGFTAGARDFSMAEILVSADGVPSMRVDIPFLCRS